MKTPLFLSLGTALLAATLAHAGTADGNAMAQTVEVVDGRLTRALCVD